MSMTICPAAVVAAPIEVVWRELAQPARYAEWADASVERIEPQGPAMVGQTIYLTSKRLGVAWRVIFHVEEVNHTRHLLGLHALFPLGMQMRPRISCAPIDASTCRVQYG
jgi:hypothetical protein